MRYELQDLYNRGPNDKHLFIAFVERYAKGKSKHSTTQLLLRDLVLIEGGKPDRDTPVRLVTNHLWIRRHEQLSRLKVHRGDLVMFSAKVAPYQRVGVRIDSSGEHDVTQCNRSYSERQDFGLECIKNARKIPRLSEKPDSPVLVPIHARR